MKIRVSIFLLVCLCFMLVGCSFTASEAPTAEIFSCISEYDNDDVDFLAFLSKVESDDTVSVSEKAGDEFCKEHVEKMYGIDYESKGYINVKKCYDAENAKTVFEDRLNNIASQRLFSPYASLIRVGEIVLEPLPTPESNLKMFDIMSYLGLEGDFTLEINTECLKKKVKTKKSVDKIVEELESREFKLIYEDVSEDESYKTQSFISSDRTDVYTVVSCQSDGANLIMPSVMGILETFIGDNDNPQMYYSFRYDCGIIFIGHSANTRELWESIR